MNTRAFVPPYSGIPRHSYCGLIRDLDDVRTWPDGTLITEWLGGFPITVTRYRTQTRVPVPFTTADWSALNAMLGETL